MFVTLKLRRALMAAETNSYLGSFIFISEIVTMSSFPRYQLRENSIALNITTTYQCIKVRYDKLQVVFINLAKA